MNSQTKNEKGAAFLTLAMRAGPLTSSFMAATHDQTPPSATDVGGLDHVFAPAKSQFLELNPGAIDMLQASVGHGFAKLAMEAYFRAFETAPIFTTTASAQSVD